jgi:glycosyltransferase involved in cell wall biosynthesis
VSKWKLGAAVTERIALELADAFVCEDQDLLDWFGRRGWVTPARRLPTPDGRSAWPVRAESRPSAEPDPPPLVSVVVAFHERTAYLPFCLEGLARQTYRELEVIVADDGSRSAAAAEQLHEVEQATWPWSLRVLHLPKGGLASARNGGWHAARGELVLFIDDDDIPFDGLVATLVRARAVSGADVAVAGARFFRGDGRPSARSEDVTRISLCNPRELGAISNQFGGPVNLWPRELLEQLGGFASVPTEDWDLLARATYAGARLTTSPEPLYWYRQTPGSMYSAEPFAFRDAGVAVRAERIAELLPEEWRLLPRLAAGAYGELERRGRELRPRWRVAVDRGVLLAKHTRKLVHEEGIPSVGRKAIRFARRRYDRQP